jgi:hypothetical protein
MPNKLLIRIGPGVPQPKGPRAVRPAAYLVLAAAVLIAVGLMVWATTLGAPKPTVVTVQASTIDKRVECTTITHAYDGWWPGHDRLVSLPYVGPEVAAVAVDVLDRDALTFFDAAAGYDDLLSRQLAAAIAGYRVELGVIAVRLQLDTRAGIDGGQLVKTLAAWDGAGAVYADFAASCQAG